MTNAQFDVLEAAYLSDNVDGSFRRALERAYAAGQRDMKERAKKAIAREECSWRDDGMIAQGEALAEAWDRIDDLEIPK